MTGGARGIGATCALRIAEEGRDIVIADIEDGSEVIGAIEKLGQRALFVKTDVSDESAVHALISNSMETFGQLDILICCAGMLGKEKPFLEQSAAEFDKVMQINVNGVYHAYQAAIPHMLRRGWGRCVTITSGARHRAPNLVPYSVSKGAVFSFVNALGNAHVGELFTCCGGEVNRTR